MKLRQKLAPLALVGVLALTGCADGDDGDVADDVDDGVTETTLLDDMTETTMMEENG